MSEIVLTQPIIDAINIINRAGLACSVDIKQDGGNSHTNNYINMYFVNSDNKLVTLRIKHTSSYSSKFSDWTGISDEFGDLCYAQMSTVNTLVLRALEIKEKLNVIN